MFNDLHMILCIYIFFYSVFTTLSLLNLNKKHKYKIWRKNSGKDRIVTEINVRQTNTYLYLIYLCHYPAIPSAIDSATLHIRSRAKICFPKNAREPHRKKGTFLLKKVREKELRYIF